MNYKFKPIKRFMSMALSLVIVITAAAVITTKTSAMKSFVKTLASAQNSFNINIGSVEGAVGDIVEVPVSINQPNSGIASYGMQINFDSKNLEVVDIVPKQGEESNFWSNYDNSEGYLRAAWVDGTGGNKLIKSAEQLFTLKLKIRSSNLGNKALVIDNSSPNNLVFSNVSGESLSTKASEGSVTIVKSQAQLVSEAKEALEIGYTSGDSANSVKHKLVLKTSGTNGTKISWSSNNTAVVNEKGEVTRPSYASGDASVVLTATISKDRTVDTKTFNIKVIRKDASANSKLKSLSISKGSLSPAFNSNVTKYNVDVDSTVSSIVLTPVLDDSLSKVTVNGKDPKEAVQLNVGVNNIIVTVTAEDGSQKQYNIAVYRSDTKKEEIKVDVEAGNAGSGSTVAQATIERTTDSKGVVKDSVALTADDAKEAVKKAVEQGQGNARIVIPDTKDIVSEVNVNTSKEAISEIAKGKLSFEVYTENARILVPSDSLNNFNDDLYFRIVPIKQTDAIKSVEDRVKEASQIKEFVKTSSVEVVGRPMTIETNMENRQVTLVLPLPDSLTANISKDNLIKDIAVYVEHHDGTKELVKGKIVSYKGDKLGLQFTINKFSTFTLIHANGIGANTASSTPTPTSTPVPTQTPTVKNDLPKTGGTPMSDYVTAGIVLILAGGLIILFKRKSNIEK